MKRLRRRHRCCSAAWRTAVAASTVAAIAAAAHIALPPVSAAQAVDAHQLPVSSDADGDLLADKEEPAIGYRAFDADQNRDGSADGVELAQRCAAVIQGLPFWYPYPGGGKPPRQVYRIEHALDGVERCEVCGAWIHMGGSQIINPLLGLEYPDPNDPLDATFLPDLALHYMEHGSFDCHGSRHSGRVDIPRLLRVLGIRFPYSPDKHEIAPNARDTDGDLLADDEELAVGLNLVEPDQDANLVPDGPQLAIQCAGVINQLPWQDQAGPNETYRWHIPVKGLETCEVCGETVNMGAAGVVNPELGISVDCPMIALHYMEHGSFGYNGSYHSGRIDVVSWVKALGLPSQCRHLGVLRAPMDLNGDCTIDFADFREFARRWLETSDLD